MSKELVSIIIFLLVYLSIIFNIFPRSIVAFTGSVLLVLLNVISPNDLISYINWEALGLILGMFIMVQTLKAVGFFDFLSSIILKKTKGFPVLIFVGFAILSGILAAFMDSITVLLFMSSLSIDIARKLKINPIPFVLSQITAANIGGSSTLMGDPPNVILGTGLGITLNQFVIRVGPIALFTLLLNTAYFLFIYRKEVFGAAKLDENYISKLRPLGKINDLYLFFTTIFSFFSTIVLLLIHKQINLSVGLVGLIGASLTLILSGKKMKHIWEIVDWEVLIFFSTLFLIIGALEKTGVIAYFINLILKFSFSNTFLLKGILIWFSAIISSIVDNVPFAASMVPVLKGITSSFSKVSLASIGLMSAYGIDVGGNFTPIGASANVIGITILSKAGFELSWKEYLKDVVPITIINLAIAYSYFLIFK